MADIDMMEYATDAEAQAEYEVELYTLSPVLQSYSESTIKSQGSYSLKGVATATSSLNKTLTRKFL